MNRIMEPAKVQEVLARLGERYPEARCALDHKNVFELLVSTMLSAQTTDKMVNIVTPALYAAYPDAAAFSKAEPADIEPYIQKIGIYRNKAKNICAMSRILMEEYGGEVPGDHAKLTKLPGVGRKTANVVLADGFGVQRIAVDTHVQRVSNRIGLVHEDNVTDTEEALMRAVPEDRWTNTHHLLIFHGRNCCAARKPNCADCPIEGLCEKNGL